MEFAEIWNMCVDSFFKISLHIFNVGVSASFFALAIIAFRAIFKKSPRWLIVALWALVAIRLICPFTFESKMSLVPSAEILPYEEIFYGDDDSDSVHFDIVKNPNYTQFAGDGNQASLSGWQTAYIPLGLYAWFCVAVIMLFYALVSYLRLRRRVSVSIPLRENILVCDEVKTPFILGVFRPRIYLPSDIDEATAELVLRHEKTHLRRKDHLWKPLGFILLSVYWFNPVLWLSYVLLCRDIELACDEKVIKDMENADKKAYSEALLSCSAPHRMITACPVAFGEVGVKNRIKSVLNYKKPAFWLVLIAVVVSIVLALCFMTDPKSENGGAVSFDGVDEISELQFNMQDIVSVARSYTVFDGLSTTDNYFEAKKEDAFCYREVSSFLNDISLSTIIDGVVNPMHEPQVSGVIRISYDDKWAVTVIFHDDFQKMYMQKHSGKVFIRSKDYAVINVEQARKFFNEKPYMTHSLVWEYNLASSAWGHSELVFLLDEKYQINGKVRGEGKIATLTNEDTGTEGISWCPEFLDGPDEYNIEIPVIAEGKEKIFSLTLSKVGKKALSTYFTVRADDLVIASFPEGYKFVLSEAESKNDLTWYYNPMLSAVAYSQLTFVLPDGYTMASCDVIQKGVSSFFHYNDDAEITEFTWSPHDPDMTVDDTEMKITAVKGNETVDFKFALKLKSQTEDGGHNFEIVPENCRITEHSWGTYLLEET